MDTLKKRFFPVIVMLIAIFSSLAAKAETAEELAAREKAISLYGEIGIGVLFVVALTAFIIWKSRHDKKEREKHLEQMKKVQANKKRAA